MGEDNATVGWLGVSGKIGVGKTTVAHCLVARLGARYVGVGDYVRAEAEERGMPLSRGALQDLGTELIAELGVDDFVASVASHAGVEPGSPSVVVDGIRSGEIAVAFADFAAPARLLLVHLEVPEALRRRRLIASGLAGDELAAADEHLSESEVADRFRERADLVVSGRESEAICSEIVTRI